MAAPLLILKDVCLSFGSKDLFTDLSLSISEQDHLCLVGRNGSGKSTLLKVMAAMIQHDKGDVFIQPGTRLVYCHQEPDFSGYETLRDYCLGGLFPDQDQESYRVDALLSQIELDGSKSPLTASGGEKRRATLIRSFASDPDILLLDEPTNHLDLEGILWLEDKLKSFKGAYVLISHDRRFLTHLSKETLWLDRGFVRRMTKGYGHFEAWAEMLLEQEMREQAKFDKVIAQETVWSHQGITARRKRNQGRLQRLNDMRAKKADFIAQTGRSKLTVKNDETPSKLVIEAKEICKTLGGQLLFKDFSTRILSGDRLGIVGPNGCGKSTLIKILLGEMPTDSGFVRLGKNLSPLYFDQSKDRLDPKQTLWETLAVRGTDQVMVHGHARHVVGYLRDFLFDPDQARSPVYSLSGGEKSRLLLAKYLAQPSNFLILDEPTNDLDMDTMNLLTDVLSDFEGTVIVISHDRDFIDQLVTSTLVFTPDQRLIEVAGGYTEATDYVKTLGFQSLIAKPSRDKSLKKIDALVEKKPKARLSYHEQRLLEVLPTEIEDLEKRLIETMSLLENRDLYLKNPDQFKRLTDDCHHLEQTIVDKEHQWFELEEKRLRLKDS